MAGHLDEETINLFLDEMLDEAARRRAKDHLATCSTCLSELARWHALFVALDVQVPASATVRAPERVSPVKAAALAPTSLSPWARRRDLWKWPAAQVTAAVVLLAWVWPRLMGGAEGVADWTVARAGDSAGWLELLWGMIVRWSQWLGDGLVSLWEGINPTLPAGFSLLQAGLAMGVLLILWVLGNRLLLQDGLRWRS